MATEEERLRRELRAMGAVNRQLQAQLDEPGAAARPTRAVKGGEWADHLAAKGASQPSLIRTSDGKVFVVEGQERREVKSGILAAGLELTMRSSREMTASELAELTEGIPVEMFEAPDGPPFVVVGGSRHTVRGIPLPHPISNRQASEFPQSDEVNVAAANVARTKYRQAASPSFQLDRLKGSVQKRGLLGTGKAAARRVSRKLGLGSKS